MNTPLPTELCKPVDVDSYTGFQHPEYLANVKATNPFLASREVTDRRDGPWSTYMERARETSDTKTQMRKYEKVRKARIEGRNISSTPSEMGNDRR